jgi:hypothetical protein
LVDGLYFGLAAYAALSAPVEADETKLQHNGNEVTFDIISLEATTARVRFTLTTQSGKMATLAVTLSQGEAVEYFLEQVAMHERVDFFSQCPDVTPSIPISKIRIEWSFESGLAIIATRFENELSRFSESGGKFIEVSEKLTDESLRLVFGLNQDYTSSMCFPQPTGEVEKIISSDSDSRVASAPDSIVLDAEQCASAMKEVCFQPLVVNQLVTVLSDGEGRENQRSLPREIQSKRRLLARALRSKEVTRINRAVRVIRRLFSSAQLSPKTEILPAGRGAKILRLLGTKGASRNTALQMVVKLLKL